MKTTNFHVDFIQAIIERRLLLQLNEHLQNI